MCLKTNFKHPNKSQVQRCKVVLKDIFKCKVLLKRLTPGQIARALRGESIFAQNEHYAHQDHCYSRASIAPQQSSHLDRVWNMVSQQRSVPIIDSSYNSFDPSSDSDSDNDDDGIDGYCVVNGKAVAYPVNADTDSDEEDTNEFVVVNGKDAQIEHDSGFDNEVQTEDFEQEDDMNVEHTPDTSSDFSDDDADMRFLNSIAEKFEQQDDVETSNCDENGHVWPTNRIFGEICVKFLRDTCYGTYCEFPHELPDTLIVDARLKSASRNEIENAQNQILLQHEILMNEYFASFCKFYGREWQMHRESLRRLIAELSQRPAAVSYMKEIFGGFLISGMEYSTCVDQLLLEFNDSLNTEERFELIWELMIDPQNENLFEQLKEFKHLLLGNALVAANAINRILQHQINGELEILRDLTINIVKSTTVTTFHKLDPMLLKQYIQLLRSLNMTDGKVIQNKAKQFGLALD